LAAALGEEALAERDQIVTNIAAALEAEGIDANAIEEEEEEEEQQEVAPETLASAVAAASTSGGDEPAMAAAFASAAASLGLSDEDGDTEDAVVAAVEGTDAKA
jgi:hypothetical protein